MKFSNLIENNSGFQTIKIISDILNGKNQQESQDIEFTPSDRVNMNYALITSVGVERSFSQYKSILRPNRRNFFICKPTIICSFSLFFSK